MALEESGLVGLRRLGGVLGLWGASTRLGYVLGLRGASTRLGYAEGLLGVLRLGAELGSGECNSGWAELEVGDWRDPFHWEESEQVETEQGVLEQGAE